MSILVGTNSRNRVDENTSSIAVKRSHADLLFPTYSTRGAGPGLGLGVGFGVGLGLGLGVGFGVLGCGPDDATQ